MESKKNTIQDIADYAGVSKSTVSRVLNDTTPVHPEKRDAVLKAIKDLDFQPNSLASGLAGGQTLTIGVLTQNIGSHFYDLVVQGIIHSMSDSKYSSLLVDGQWESEQELEGVETLIRRQVDGLIIAGGGLNVDYLKEIESRQPVLFVGREIEEMKSQCVFVDNFDGGYQATKYLLDLGHKNIAHIIGSAHQPDARRRLAGYKAALSDSGVELDDELLFQGDFDAPSGEAAVEHWLSKGKKFTAIFAGNDPSAYGARLALYRCGIDVPEQVSIIGFDDQVESAYMTPPLTSVSQPAFEMGVTVGEAMLRLLGGMDYYLPAMPVEIIERESTARLGP